MLSESQKLKLGVFVIGAVVLMVAVILVFAGGELFQETIRAHTYFTESVQGLEAGAAVKFRGVPVGQVTAIEISGALSKAVMGDEKLRILVRMEIRQQEGGGELSSLDEVRDFIRQQIKRGARCQLVYAGITGMKFLQIDYYAKDGEESPDHVAVEDSFFIPSAPSLLAGVTTDLTDTLAKIANIPFDQLGQDTKKLVNDVSSLAKSVKALVNDKRVDSIMSSLSATSENVAKLTSRVEASLSDERMAGLMKEFEGTLSSVRKLLEDTRKQVGVALTEIGGLATETRTQLAGAKLGETLESTRNGLAAAEAALKTFSHLRTDLQPTVDRLDQAIRSFGELARALEEDPSALLRGKRKPKSRIWSK